MTFFQSFPVPAVPPQPRSTRYIPPPWAAAPAYELPAVIHLGKFLHRSPTMVVALKSADVYSTGCSFSLSWLFRRGEQTDEDWAGLQHLFFHPGMSIRPGRGQHSGLMFGVQFPDGSKASTVSQRPLALMDTGQQAKPPVLALNNAGGSGADDEFFGTGRLWMWPLPPTGDLHVFIQWLDLGLQETSTALDGGQLRDAAAHAQLFWPEEESPRG